MHVTDRSLGGCDDALCVVAGCRDCHRAYDEGTLDALPVLEKVARPELAHALLHLGLERLRWRVTNQRAA